MRNGGGEMLHFRGDWGAELGMWGWKWQRGATWGPFGVHFGSLRGPPLGRSAVLYGPIGGPFGVPFWVPLSCLFGSHWWSFGVPF